MKTGDTVADFELPDQSGKPRKLSDLLSTGPVVLFFYPAAMTPGCTKEACHFRDLAAEFAAVGANRAGISVDPVDKQAKFAGKQNFDYPLLSDTDGKIASTSSASSAVCSASCFRSSARRLSSTDPTAGCSIVIGSEISIDTHCRYRRSDDAAHALVSIADAPFARRSHGNERQKNVGGEHRQVQLIPAVGWPGPAPRSAR